LFFLFTYSAYIKKTPGAYGRAPGVVSNEVEVVYEAN